MKLKDFSDSTIKQLLQSVEADSLTRFLLADDQLKCSLIHGTRMINEMRANHDLGPLETWVLGQGYVAGGLLSSTIKGQDRITLTVEGGGPMQGMSVEAFANGDIRGSLKVNPIPLEKPLEKLSMDPLLSPGFLSITRINEGSRQPFTGQVMIEYGELANDLANYFVTSEQTPTAFILSVKFDHDGHAIGAGGLLIQALPGADTDLLGQLQNLLEGLPSIGDYFAAGGKADDYIQAFFKDYNPRILTSGDVRFHCPCDHDRIGSFIASLGDKEKEDILQNGPFPLVTTCHNCNSAYHFQKDELKVLFS